MEVRQGYKATDIGVIPIDWGVEKLSTLTNKIGSGITPTGGEKVYKKEGKPFMRSQNVGWGILALEDIAYIDNETHSTFSTTEIKEGDVLLNITGASIGRSAIADTRIRGGNVNQHVCIIRPDKNKLDPKYLNSFILSAKGQKLIESYQSGGNRQGLNFGQIKTFAIPLPNIEEQTAIATALNDADAVIGTLEKLIDKKRNIKQGAIQQLLQPKKGWETKRLDEVARYRRGSFPQPYGLDKWYDDTNGFPFIQVFDVDDNMKLKRETKWRISKEAQNMSVFVPTGTIVLTIQGSIGRIAMTQYDTYIDRTLLIFESYIVPFNKYFFMLLVHILFEQEKQRAPGGTIKTITKEALSSFKISFPKIAEQNRIAEVLSDMDKEIIELEAKLEKYRMLKHGMMQNLLTGKIRLV